MFHLVWMWNVEGATFTGCMSLLVFKQECDYYNGLREWMNQNKRFCDRLKNRYFHMPFIYTGHWYLWKLFDCLKWSDLMLFQFRMEVYFIAKTVTFKHKLDALVSLGRPWQSCCRHGNPDFSFRSGPSGTNFILGKCARWVAQEFSLQSRK